MSTVDAAGAMVEETEAAEEGKVGSSTSDKTSTPSTTTITENDNNTNNITSNSHSNNNNNEGPSSSTFTIQINPNEPLSTLSNQIENMTGLRPHEQRLIYRGRIINVPTATGGANTTGAGGATTGANTSGNNATCIRDIHGLSDGETIHLVPRHHHHHGITTDVCCANCGMPEVDEIKLEECTDCHLVRYCGDNCRGNHREEHSEECKIWKALLHDRKLFTQPDGTHQGECPLCFLPLPLDGSKSLFWTCCSEVICNGCMVANYKSNKYDEMKALTCPFCRELDVSGAENDKRAMKRVKANDPAALCHMGKKYYREGDYEGAIEYYTKAAELGEIDAHYHLGWMYEMGRGVEKDEEKSNHHWEIAAIGGDPTARYSLACIEEENGNMGRAVKHHIIAANLGYDLSMKALWKHYSLGNITKENLDATLRTHQAAVDAMKSEQRDAAEVALRRV